MLIILQQPIFILRRLYMHKVLQSLNKEKQHKYFSKKREDQLIDIKIILKNYLRMNF